MDKIKSKITVFCIVAAAIVAGIWWLTLPLLPDIMVIRDKEHLDKITAENHLVVVEVYTDRCPACRKMAPNIERFAREYYGEFKVVKLNASDNTKLATRLGITAVPTTLVYRDGELVGRTLGAIGYEKFAKEMLKYHKAADSVKPKKQLTHDHKYQEY